MINHQKFLFCQNLGKRFSNVSPNRKHVVIQILAGCSNGLFSVDDDDDVSICSSYLFLLADMQHVLKYNYVIIN